MAEKAAEGPIPEERRRAIFLALVDYQDHELSVSESRKLVAERFGITPNQLLRIEREGMDLKWPPLDG